MVPHPPIIRGLEMIKKALIAAGHKGETFDECSSDLRVDFEYFSRKLATLQAQGTEPVCGKRPGNTYF